MRNERKKKKKVLSKWSLKAPLWLDLLSGFIVLIASPSGVFFVFDEDILTCFEMKAILHQE